MKLSEYILQPRSVRIAHIDLSTACEPRRNKVGPNKQEILDFLGVENNIENWTAGGVDRCHLCECDSQNGWCGNVLHYYLGTRSENGIDFIEANPDHPRANGSGVYCDLTTGDCRRMLREEAEALGWVGATSGKSPYCHPVTNECRLMTCEEAEASGWIHVNSGRTSYTNPETGDRKAMAKEEAEQAGWVHSTAGTGTYKNLETGECRRMTQEEAQSAGYVGSTAGRTNYIDPQSGEIIHTTSEEAKARGLVGIRAGSTYTPRVVKCPHCGLEGSAVNMKRWHFDNCDQREGSWRWFKAQLKQWSKEQKQLRT